MKMKMHKPKSEAELAGLIAGAKGPLHIRGGGTRDIGAPVTGEGLSVAGLSGITLYEPGALTLVAQAGTPLAEVEATLAAEGQRLAFEPMDHRGLLGTKGVPTIGGVVAANVSGPRRIAVGACRDFLLGVRFVDGAGTILKNGGRVMKNVTGYDLVKLMAGSWGTLGVITEVSLKVLPVPAASAIVLIDGLTDSDAVRAMAMALGSPYEVTGAAHAPNGTQGTALTLFRIEGFAASVAYRAEALQKLLGKFGALRVESDAAKTAALSLWVRDVEPFHKATGDVWRLSVKPSDAAGIAGRLNANDLLFDWGGGLIWALIPQGRDIRADLGVFGGHATLIRASPKTRRHLQVFHPEAPGIAALSRGLRQRFDPRGILNPGLMGGT